MTLYRDDLDAARARIETLEAKLRERDAAIEARDAEIAELRADIARRELGGPGRVPSGHDDSRAARQALFVALGACGFMIAAAYALVRPTHCRSRVPPPWSTGVEISASRLAVPPARGPGALDERRAQDEAPSDATGTLDRRAAMLALQAAAEEARRCGDEVGPTGSGRVKVVYDPSGSVLSVDLRRTPFAGTPVGDCVEETFLAARVPPFKGASVTVSKTVTIR